MSNQKIYVGGAKEINGNFGAFHRISFNKQDLETMMNNLNAKGYINLNMNKRREPSQYGQTHSLIIDTWEPNQGQADGGYQQQNQGYQQQQAPQYQQPAYQPPPSQQSNDMADLNSNRPPVTEMPNFDDINDPEDCPF